MRKRAGLIAAALLAGGMSIGLLPGATAAPPPCEPGTAGYNGCKTEETTEVVKDTGGKSNDFVEETVETQRGNPDAKGTDSTEEKSEKCYGPSGKELSPDHPQCQ